MALQSAFTLTANLLFQSLGNMIISQEVFADNIGKHQTLVDKARVDGSLYGDRKLYYATQVLASQNWLNDSEATNLLQLHRPKDPSVQAIVLDTYRMIPLTVDNYLSKQPWQNEYAFSQFNSVMLGWISETKKVYDGTLYNTFIGTTETSVGKQMQTIDITTARGNASSEEEANKLEAMAIGQSLADLLVDMGDYTSDYNDYQYLRSYADSDIKVIWNSKFVNKIRKVDTPVIFHKDSLVDKLDGDILPSRYFGRAIAAGDKGSGKVIGSDGTYDNTKGTLRAKKELTVTISETVYHFFPGDLIPNGVTVKSGGNFAESEVYLEDADIICKIVVKLPPYMSAFETGTSFFNPRSLTETHFKIWAHNTLQYLKNYPFITVKKV